MSRHLNTSSYEPTKQEREIEAHVHFIIQASLDCVSIEEMQYHTARDTTLPKIMEIMVFCDDLQGTEENQLGTPHNDRGGGGGSLNTIEGRDVISCN